MKRRENIFNSVPIKSPQRNNFDLSHEVKMSGKFTYLYPTFLCEAMPGDVFKNTSTNFIRLAPMLAPIMHRLDVTTHFFFVPSRLLTDHWEDFITGGMDGEEAPVLPYITPAGLFGNGAAEYMEKGTMWDYMGLPVINPADNPTSTERISVLPFRAYAKVWNDYYKDPNFEDDLDLKTNLQNDVSVTTTDDGIMELRRRGWRKDYFTSALPNPQRGPQVLMPIEGSGVPNYYDISIFEKGAQSSPTQPGAGNATFDGTLSFLRDGVNAPIRVENMSSVDFQNTSVTINDFRTALATQTWLENNARGGYRYVDQIASHFNTRVPDYRLQRAEYLGGGKQPIRISEVVATNRSADVDLGDLGGHGISVGKSNSFSYHCAEHGYILGILSIMPETAYSQGIERMWSRHDKFDYAWPEMAHLGEQAILSKEIFFENAAAQDPFNQLTFGYTPRYSEFKFKNDRIAGDFRDTLRFWHLGRIFLVRPSLDAEFTTANEDDTTDIPREETMRRIFAVTDGTDYVWMEIFHRCSALRPLPYFGVPKLVG